MWGNDGRGAPLPSSFGMSRQGERRAPGEPSERPERPERPILPDVAGLDGEDDMDARMELPGGAAEVDSPAWRRLRARRTIREFLRSMPRTELNEAVTFLRPDGEPRTVTRGELSAMVDRMRPRMRRIILLAVEQHWPRRRVCEQMGISIKTYERDYVEALDMLIHL